MLGNEVVGTSAVISTLLEIALMSPAEEEAGEARCTPALIDPPLLSGEFCKFNE